MGSSPNGTLYSRYLVYGLYTLRQRAHEKVQLIHEEISTRAHEKREATFLNWKESHPDVNLDCHPASIFRTWPPDLMGELDEIDREMVRCERSSSIALLVEAEKEMQGLIKFWRECGLITGQRTPPSPEMPLLPDPSTENPSPSGSLSSPPTQDESSQLQTDLTSPARKSEPKIPLSGPRNVWDGRLRSRAKKAKTNCPQSRSSRHKFGRKPGSTKTGLLEPRSIWEGRLRSSTKKDRVIGQTSRISKPKSN